MEVWTAADAIEMWRRVMLRKSRVCGIDCETEGIDPKKEPAAGPRGRIVCWTLSWDNEDAFIWHNRATAAILAPALKALPVVGHNIWGFDAHMFRKSGMPLGNVVADTMRQHKLINPSEEASHGLKTLMKYWLNIEPVGGFEELFTRHKCLEVVPEEQGKWELVDEEAGVYEQGEPYRLSHRKVGEWTRVPSLVGGAHSRIGSVTEFIPLSSIREEYPHLLPTLIRYAKLDARATLELYKLFDAKLKETPWTVPLLNLATTASPPASGLRSP